MALHTTLSIYGAAYDLLGVAVDDFILLSESREWLVATMHEIERFLAARLALRLNASKTILQRAARGVDFVGQVVKPWRRHPRRRVVAEALRRTASADAADLVTTANSYFGLLRQATASHRARALLARAVLQRGLAVDRRLTKACAAPEAK